jgi:hypothetical protein
MMNSIEKSRAVIQQHADLIEKQEMGNGFASLSVGKAILPIPVSSNYFIHPDPLPRTGQKQLREELVSWKEPLESTGV